MKILVTGASGFIGSGLVSTLATLYPKEQGHEILALMRSTASNEYLKGVTYTRVTGDLSEPESLVRACEGVEVVFHLAGLTAAKNREEYFKFNGEGTRNLASAAVKAGTVKKFIYVSSLAASGPSPGLCPRSEIDPEHPVSTYGESKLRGELYLDEFKGKLPFIVFRPPMVYGPRDKAVFLLFKTVSKNFMPLLPSRTPTGHKYYSAIHVDDLIDAMVESLHAPEECFQTGERFFISDGQIYTYERILSIIAKELKVVPLKFTLPHVLVTGLAKAGTLAGRVLKTNLPINDDKLNEIAPDYWICSSEKINDKLHFKAKYTMESGVAQTVAWYKVNGWL